MPKHVWILNHASHTPSTGKWTRHYHMALELKQFGWVTRVITASVDRHSATQFLNPGEKFRHVNHDGVPFTYLRTSPFKGHGAGRVANMLTFMFRALTGSPHRGIQNPDVIIGCTVHPFAAFAGWVLAWRFRVPFVFEVRDLWPETLIQLGLTTRGSLFARGLAWLERFLFRRARRIVSTLPNLDLYLEERGLDASKVRWITNGIDLVRLPKPASLPRRKTFRLLYIGSLAYSYGLESLIEAMILLHQRNLPRPVELHLVGDGELQQQLEERVRDAGLKNVIFRGLLPKREIPNVAAEAHGFVMLVRDLPDLYRYGISMNKLPEYLAAGRPVLISIGDKVNNMVAEAGAGITVPPDSPLRLAEGIETLLAKSREDLAAMGSRGRRYAEQNLDYSYLAKRLADLLDEVVASQKTAQAQMNSTH